MRCNICIFALGIILSITSITTAIAQSEQPTPSGTRETFLFLPTFPPVDMQSDLFCFMQDLALGETWQDIQIGRSTLVDLEQTLAVIAPYEKFASLSYGNLMTTTYHATEAIPDMPIWISVCVQAGVISALLVQWVETDVELADLVNLYGAYDSVTWSPSVFHRVAFWFEEGIAAEVFVGSGGEPGFGGLSSIIYFVPQPIEGYESRWPFSNTQPREHPPQWSQGLLTVQDPFDIDTISATLTARPSRTLTPTLTPRAPSTVIPILTPTFTP